MVAEPGDLNAILFGCLEDGDIRLNLRVTRGTWYGSSLMKISIFLGGVALKDALRRWLLRMLDALDNNIAVNYYLS